MSWWPFSRKPSTPLDSPRRIETPSVEVRPPPRPDPIPPDVPMPAGIAWCARYPASDRIEDLVPPFRENVEQFLAHLLALGCRVRVTSTLRPEPRAWLMRMTWDLVHGLVDLDEIPVRSDLRIVWSLVGALDMFHGYGLRARPALDSRHIHGRALDLEVEDWMGSDADLWALGARFGVHKLITNPPDPVHWSDDGH